MTGRPPSSPKSHGPLATIDERLQRGHSAALGAALLTLVLLVAAVARAHSGTLAHQLLGSGGTPVLHPVPAPVPPLKRKSWTTSSVAEWERKPRLGFSTPQSGCSIDPDGLVRRMPPPPPSSPQLPFLFNLTAEALPTQEEACSHCPQTFGCDPLPASLPAACCGVCGFERRFCSKVYPGERKGEQVAERFVAEGHPLHGFTPCELFQRIRGRTLWLLGDSQTWHFYYALECFLREFAPSLQRTPPLPSKQLSRQLITASIYLCYEPYPVPPICLPLAHGTRVCMVRADNATVMADAVLPLLQRHSPSFNKDVLVLNTGLHYYDDVMCEDGSCKVPGRDSAYVRDLQKLADYRATNLASLPCMIWMDTPVQHFPGTGNFAGKFRAKQCEPLEAWQQGDPVARAGGTWNVAAAPLVRSLADAHLATWNASVRLWDSHMPGECTHWCQPGAYSLWTYLLNNVMRDERLGRPVRLRPQPA